MYGDPRLTAGWSPMAWVRIGRTWWGRCRKRLSGLIDGSTRLDLADLSGLTPQKQTGDARGQTSSDPKPLQA
ncbi:hypothetical protein NDU88_006792 [Pleurodeles waltl]|uniref:Uncharacterized protein n=1 Tax=Pleurodeles waltl TaxID=8319 RepID=A0AAV7X1P6_PLEWA|nr:hypothetical protein NDU88_006792 [Pleurodeles waltl]